MPFGASTALPRPSSNWEARFPAEPILQAQLQARQVELQSLQQVAGPESVQLQTVRAQIAALQSQLAATDQPSQGAGGPNISGLSELQSRYLDLYRDYRFAQALYEVYARASEQTAVESLVTESATYIQVVEPANLDADRHYNIAAVGLLVALALMALFTELYVPATGLEWRDVFGRSNEAYRD